MQLSNPSHSLLSQGYLCDLYLLIRNVLDFHDLEFDSVLNKYLALVFVVGGELSRVHFKVVYFLIEYYLEQN